MVGFSHKAITPKVQYNPTEFVRDIQRRATNTRNQIKRDFEGTTRHWKTPVVFQISKKKTGDSYTFTAFTDNEIYGYVNDGTDPHVIRAKNAPYLVFTVGGVAKTSVNSIKSGKGSRGSQWVSKKEVKHPGTKARKFDEKIAQRFKDRWVKESNEALSSWLQKTSRPARSNR
jgi:hypothetical protein